MTKRKMWRMLPACPQKWLTAAVALFMLSACTTAPPEAPRQARSPQKVAIVVSQRAAVFDDVAEQLQQELAGNATRYYLTGKNAADNELAKAVTESSATQVVVIGLPAALWSNQIQRKQIVFCQVFNHQQYRLVSEWRKGVSSVPPAEQLFTKWKTLSPSLRRVVTITGPMHKSLIAHAKNAAAKEGIRLDHMVVRSDKEFRYTFKNRVGKYQGIWLLPDNRVLSRSTMREVMSYSIRHGKQVAVFNPQLLSIGGLISAEPVPEDVAVRVLDRLRKARPGAAIPGPGVVPLGKTRFQINKVLVRQLGLTPSRTPTGNGA
ncbi:MAG: hypothetical protein LJE56_03825 [Acidiferrobacterales bacterium]|nr:hypothetical protein [Acidiferrobacterales bacterium]